MDFPFIFPHQVCLFWRLVPRGQRVPSQEALRSLSISINRMCFQTCSLSLSLSALLQPEEIQQQIVRETFHLVLKRDDNICNFLEGGR